MSVTPKLPTSWAEALASEIEAPYFHTLLELVETERAAGSVFPPDREMFAAFEATPLDRVCVVLIGQDPYHAPGQAHGLAFSVRPGVPPPPSLANMLKELQSDLGLPSPDNGDLTPWARQGVLLLNTVLTVAEGMAGSHRRKGWETFTDAVVRVVNARPSASVFVLWGNDAKKSARFIDSTRHRILEGVHPSPLSAYAGFVGSKPYSRINAALVSLGHRPIDWALPDLGVPFGPRSRRARKADVG